MDKKEVKRRRQPKELNKQIGERQESKGNRRIYAAGTASQTRSVFPRSSSQMPSAASPGCP